MLNNDLTYIMNEDSLTVCVKGNRPFTINSSHINYKAVIQAIKDNRVAVIESLLDVAKSIKDFSQGKVTIEGNNIYYDGYIVDNSLTRRMLKMISEGFTITPMINFLNNLMLNPEHRAIQELYTFLDKNNLPITPDGHFLAYKYVTSTFLDAHTRTIDNSVGKVVEMPRQAVNSDRNQTCSTGLHFCSIEYLQAASRDSNVVILKINPADVVSIPSDYNNSKGRCCRYEVIDVFNQALEGKEYTEDSVYQEVDISELVVGSSVVLSNGETMTVLGISEGVSRYSGNEGYKVTLLENSTRGSKRYSTFDIFVDNEGLPLDGDDLGLSIVMSW